MKLFLGFSFLTFIAIQLVSCAAALVPETSDPQVKLSQGYQLIQMGRSLAARKVMEQALTMYNEKKDELGAAKAHMALADLYRTGSTHGDLKLPDFFKAAQAEENAAESYAKANLKMHHSMLLWMAGDLYGMAGEQVKACQLFLKSKKSFDPKATDTEGLINPDKLPIRIRMSQDGLKCNDLKNIK